MSRSITTQPGDTFESVARRAYGDEAQVFRLHSANPGVYFPSEFTSGEIPAGTSLVVPDLPDDVRNQILSTQSDGPDEISVLLDSKRFRFWQTMEITRSVDSMDTIQLSAPFEADAEGFKSAFRPLSFRPITVTLGGAPLFTGTAVGIRPSVTPAGKTMEMSGYSTPGVLNDCNVPASAAPLEFNNQKLTEIAGTIAGYFGITVDFRADPGAVFDRVSANASKKALSFLTELATQRNLIISSTSSGDLLIWQAATAETPVASLKQGEQPLSAIIPTFKPQSYYSHLTGIQPTELSFLAGPQTTEVNPRLSGVLRPLTFMTPDTPGADAAAAVKSKLGRMFGEAVTYTIEVPTWRAPNGALWAPNQTIEIEAPDAMVYGPFKFLVRSVRFRVTPKARTATLNLILPGALRGEAPDSFPWDL